MCLARRNKGNERSSVGAGMERNKMMTQKRFNALLSMLLCAAMLLIGLIITMGIGSSFSTVPLIAAIYVPLCAALGISPLATIAIVGSAGALGDAGSPVSESVLGPTAGLNADGQHDHIYDSTIPTFLHYNLPLLAAGWIAGMIL